MMRRWRMAVTLLAVVLAAAGCGYSGLDDLPVPGARGTGNGSYTISALIPSAGGLVANAPVQIDDVEVGSVGDIRVVNWNADVTIRLDPGVKVRKGSHVQVGMTSVLGSTHLEIVQPDTPTAGYLRAGDTIPLPACPAQANIAVPDTPDPVPDIDAAQQVPGCSYPTTEQVLSALSVVLNGGGLAQFGDIVKEMSALFDGRSRQIADLIPRLGTLVGDLDRQRGTIIDAMDGLDRLTGEINRQTPTVEKALAEAPKILGLLNEQRPQFVTALAALAKLSRTANDVLDASSRDITTVVQNLRPATAGLAAAGPALPASTKILLTFPFLEETIPQIVKGDYVNSDLVLDLTFDKLKSTIFRSVGVVGPEGVMGQPAGNAGRGLNPFTAPLDPSGQRPPDTDRPVPAPGALPGGGGGGR
ncbi:virulence factor Mce family protein [Gordonia sinesedis]